MDDIPFYRTRIGQQFYEHSMPALVSELARLKELLARLVQRVETQWSGGPGNSDSPLGV